MRSGVISLGRMASGLRISISIQINLAGVGRRSRRFPYSADRRERRQISFRNAAERRAILNRPQQGHSAGERGAMWPANAFRYSSSIVVVIDAVDGCIVDVNPAFE